MSTHDEYLDNRAGNSGPGNEDHSDECTCPNCETERTLPELCGDPIPTKLGLELEASLMQLKELTPLTDQGVRTLRGTSAKDLCARQERRTRGRRDQSFRCQAFLNFSTLVPLSPAIADRILTSP